MYNMVVQKCFWDFVFVLEDNDTLNSVSNPKIEMAYFLFFKIWILRGVTRHLIFPMHNTREKWFFFCVFVSASVGLGKYYGKVVIDLVENFPTNNSTMYHWHGFGTFNTPPLCPEKYSKSKKVHSARTLHHWSFYSRFFLLKILVVGLMQ